MSNVRKGYAKLTVTLYIRQIAMLDSLAVDMRLRHGVAVTRSAIIRALVDLDETKRKGAKRRKS